MVGEDFDKKRGKRMNYKDFMEQVKEKLVLLSEKEKSEWIYEQARQTAKEKREAFLLSFATENKEGRENDSPINEKENDWDWIDLVEEREIWFEKNIPEYIEWDYWDMYPEAQFEDPFDIVGNLQKSLKTVESLVDRGLYSEARDLGERMLFLTFPVEDEEMGDEEWTFFETVEEVLPHFDVERFVCNIIYAVYHLEKGKKRAGSVYSYLSMAETAEISLETVFKVGRREPEGMDVFIKEWVEFLADTKGDCAGVRLIEACLFVGGAEFLRESSKKYYRKHPMLLYEVCKTLYSEKDWDGCEAFGMEALDLLPKNLVLRGKIAEITMKAAEYLGHEEVVRKCCQEAFDSHSTVKNFIRLFSLSNYETVVERAFSHAMSLQNSENDSLNLQWNLNRLPKFGEELFPFFAGKFESILERIGKKSQPNYKIPYIWTKLFMFLLDRNENLTDAAFYEMEKILGILEFDSTEECFAAFVLWREKQSLTSEQRRRYMEWLTEQVDLVVEDIVGQGKRDSYIDAASQVVLLGEIRESNGDSGSRQETAEHYRKLHSRKWAFKEELKAFL